MKFKYLFTTGLLALAATNAHSQLKNMLDNVQDTKGDTNLDTIAWLHNGTFVLGANQGILHNWPAGGELSSLQINGLINGYLTYYHHRHIWSTIMESAYGLFYAYSNDFIPRKTDDRFDLTSKYGYRLSPTQDLYLTVLLNAKTQFTRGHNYDDPNWQSYSTSNILSPLYLTAAPGVEYRRGTRFSVFVSPIGTRTTFVRHEYTDTTSAFGVKQGKTVRFELGSYLTARYQVELGKNITYKSRLDLFTNYLAKNTYDANGELVSKDSPKNMYVYFDNFASFKFFKFFSLNLGLTLAYDNSVPYVPVSGTKKEPFRGLGWWQVKQIGNIGFNYTF